MLKAPLSQPLQPPPIDPGSEAGGDWAMTYGDLMSLLLVFFVLLASYSSVDVVKYRSMVGSLQEAFGSRDRTLDDAQLDSSPTRGIASAAEEKERQRVEQDAETMVEELEGPFQLLQTAEGMRLRIGGQVLFPSSRADLLESAGPLLDRLAPLFRRYPYAILVEGHTDDRPIRNHRFPSNWELSAARAASVVRGLTERGVPPDRFAAIGYADTRPIAPNRDNALRAKNRRVEFLFSLPPEVRREAVPARAIADPIPGPLRP